MSVKLDLRNKIINGSLDYWQRNTSFASIANNTYHADRFHYIKTGTMVHTVSRSTDVPSSAFGIYSMLVDCTTAQASILAGSYAGVLQHIEGNVLRSFKGRKMVLSFWVKATKTGTYCVALRNGTSTKAYIMEYTVSTTNTWEKKTLRFAHDETGTWAYDNTIGLTVVWTIAAGSTFQTTANTWANGNFLATANQVNACDAATNDFQLSDICLQEDNDGQTRLPDFQLAGRDVFDELRLCQRYYEKSYNRDVVPGTIDITSAGYVLNISSGSAQAGSSNTFKIIKRGQPSLAVYNPAILNTLGANSNGVAAAAANTAGTNVSLTIYALGVNGFATYVVAAGSVAIFFQWTADAEL